MTTAKTMQAAVLNTDGAAFRVASGAAQVLVRIEASAVNPLDIKIRAGQALTRASRCLPFSASTLRALSR
jgi:NADPH:quinone reductase